MLWNPFKRSYKLLAISIIASTPPILFSETGEVRIAGSNHYGQLGNGESNFSANFVEIASDVTEMSLNQTHGLFSTSDGKTWGIGATPQDFGLFGNHQKSTESPYTFEPVLVADNLEQFWAHRQKSFYKFKNDTKLYASGASSIAVWDGPNTRISPEPVFELENIVDVKSSSTGAYFLTESQSLYAIGRSTLFQLPSYSSEYIEEPLLVEGNVIDMQFFNTRAYYLKANGELYESGTPSRIASNVAQLADTAGYTSGDIYFINNESKLQSFGGPSEGHASNVRKAIIVQTVQNTVFYITTDNKLFAYGSNNSGWFGTGNYAWQWSALLISEDVKDIKANSETLWVLKNDGTLLGSGRLTYGLLTEPPTEPSRKPTVIRTNSKKMLLGHGTSYILSNNNDLYGLGRNRNGQLGKGLPSLVLQQTLIDEGVSNVWATTLYTMYLDNNNILRFLGEDNRGNSLAGYNSIDVVDAAAGSSIFASEKIDGSLWMTNLNYWDTTKVAQNVIDFYVGWGGISYVTDEGELFTQDSNFIETYTTYKTTFPPGPGIIDTNVKSVYVYDRRILYIKNDNSLWVIGDVSDIWPNEDLSDPGKANYIIDPIQIDTDVAKADTSYDNLTYLKTDGSLWIKTNNTNHLPPWVEAASEDPIQIWKGATIQDFAVSSSNIMLLVESEPEPSIISLSRESTDPLQVGEPVDLLIEYSGGFNEFQWYIGEIGDKTNPIANSNSPSPSLYPYFSTSYWLEITNDAGSATSSISVEVDFPEYGTWAEAAGFEGQDGVYNKNPDSDDATNLHEFALNRNPNAFEKSALSTQINQQSNSLKLSFPQSLTELVNLRVETFDQASRKWIPQPTISSESDTHTTTQIPLPSEVVELLIRIQAELTSTNN